MLAASCRPGGLCSGPSALSRSGGCLRLLHHFLCFEMSLGEAPQRQCWLCRGWGYKRRFVFKQFLMKLCVGWAWVGTCVLINTCELFYKHYFRQLRQFTPSVPKLCLFDLNYGPFPGIDVESNSVLVLRRGETTHTTTILQQIKAYQLSSLYVVMIIALGFWEIALHFHYDSARFLGSSRWLPKRLPNNVTCSISWSQSLPLRDTVSENDELCFSSASYIVGRCSVCRLWSNDLHVECDSYFCIESINAPAALGHTFPIPAFLWACKAQLCSSTADRRTVNRASLLWSSSCARLTRRSISVFRSHSASESDFAFFCESYEPQRF